MIKNIESDINNALDILNDAYFTVRYPGDFESVSNEFAREKVEVILDKTKELYKWLKRQIVKA